MQTKKCYKCGRELPLPEFYKHPQMGDGHLNKCKECTKKDVKRDYERKSSDESWMEKERARGREKYKRLGYVKYDNITRRDFNPPSSISKILRTHGFNTTGKEAHHWNYNLPRSVFLMSRKAHHRLHTNIIMNREDKYCYTNDGVKLETAEQAKFTYEKILKGYGINEVIQLIEL